MPRVAKKRQDDRTRQIYAALKKVFSDLPDVTSEVVYLYNPVSIRIRVIDPRFEGKGTAERERMVNRALKTLPPEVTEDITLLLMLTPEEAEKSSTLSREFDDPTDSHL